MLSFPRFDKLFLLLLSLCFTGLFQLFHFYFDPEGGGTKYCTDGVRLSVCLSACVSQPHAQTSQNFMYTLSVAVDQSCSDGSGVYYVFLGLWMTSCFLVMGLTSLGVGSISVWAVLDIR